MRQKARGDAMKLRGILWIAVAVIFATVSVFACYSEDASQRYIAKFEKKPGGGKDSKYWVSKIGDPVESIDAFKYLIELNDKSVQPDLLVLFDKDKAHRGDIAIVLAGFGDKSVVQKLINGIILERPEKIDQRQVVDRTNEKIAVALGRLGDPAAKPAIIKLLGQDAGNVINAAIKAEIVFKDPAAVPALVAITKKDNLARNIRSDAVKVLGEIGDPSAVPALVRAMYVEKGGTLYPEASFALMQIGSPAVPELVMTLEGKNKEVEEIGKNFIVGAIPAKAADTLGWICDKSSYDALARVLQKSHEDNPFATAKTAYAIARLQDKRGAMLISKYVVDEEDPGVRQNYLLALNLIGDPSVLPALFKAVKKPDVDKYKKDGASELELNVLRESRNEVVRAIARIGSGKNLAEYEKMMKAEKDDKIKKTMEDNMPMLQASKECEAKLDCWIGKLNDQNKFVREKAAYQIGRIGGDQAMPILVNLIDDKEQAVQYAALQGIYNNAERNGAKLLELVIVKEGQMDKTKRERMTEDLKLLKLRLVKASGKK